MRVLVCATTGLVWQRRCEKIEIGEDIVGEMLGYGLGSLRNALRKGGRDTRIRVGIDKPAAELVDRGRVVAVGRQ